MNDGVPGVGDSEVAQRVADYTAARPLGRFSEVRLITIALANAIPKGRWSTYKDLATAFQYANRRYELGFKSTHDQHTLAILLDDLDIRDELGGPSVPWHRLRDQDGLLRAKGRGKVYDPNDIGNRLLAQECGRALIGASAPPPRRFHIDREVRDADWYVVNLGSIWM